MSTNNEMPNETKLRALLCESCPTAELPPGFEAAVWRRIELTEVRTKSLPFPQGLDLLATWFLRPGRALATAAAMLLLGLSLGFYRGASRANDLAKARYLDAVSPPALRQ